MEDEPFFSAHLLGLFERWRQRIYLFFTWEPGHSEDVLLKWKLGEKISQWAYQRWGSETRRNYRMRGISKQGLKRMRRLYS